MDTISSKLGKIGLSTRVIRGTPQGRRIAYADKALIMVSGRFDIKCGDMGLLYTWATNCDLGINPAEKLN